MEEGCGKAVIWNRGRCGGDRFIFSKLFKEEGHRNEKLACSKPAQGDCSSLGTND